MFTGIIQALGRVQSMTVEGDAKIFKVDTFGLACNSQVGDSLSINGACMTLTAIEAGLVWFTTISESLNLTNLNDLLNGSPVNLELAATLNTVLGGHIVSGHIDTMAELIEVIPKATGQEVWINVPKRFMKFIIPKGSVCLDGISLTVAEVVQNRIRVALIPETLNRTTAGHWTAGTKINLEIDQIARHVARQLEFKTEG